MTKKIQQSDQILYYLIRWLYTKGSKKEKTKMLKLLLEGTTPEEAKRIKALAKKGFNVLAINL